MITQPNILIIGTVWPEPDSSAAGSRMMQLIDIFIEHNCQVTVCSTANDSEFMFDLKSKKVHKQKIELNNSSFDEFIALLNPDIVLFDRFMIEEQFGWRVAEFCPKALRVLDTEDLHCLRLARQIALKRKEKFTINDLQNDVAKREIASIYRCDISLIISEYEMELLDSIFKVPKAILYYLPFLLNEISDVEVRNWKPFDERSGYLFIGNFLHEPNWDAVLYLKNEIWPIIRKIQPSAQLNIYGAYTSEKVLQLNNTTEGFNVLGRASSIENVMKNARICLVPLRFGAGIKGKLLDAMQLGAPNITTTIGAESMEIKNTWSGIITDDTAEFAKAAVSLYNDKSTWKQAQKSGQKIINERFLKLNYVDFFFKHLIYTSTNLTEHRLGNFTGAMLLHHSINGTKYMSRWIEEKNKKS
jgi:glycosyltransferase involved in cell wall biosynthesis